MLLLENTIYNSPAEREELVQDKERVAKLFLTTFVGFIALYGSREKQKAILKSYLMTEKRVTLRNIGDENSDFSIVVKLALEAGVIKIAHAREMTKLLYLMKKLSIDKVDEEALRNLIIPNIGLRSALTGKYKREYLKYLDSSIDVYQMIYNLRNLIKNDEDLSSEFREIFIQYIPSLKLKVKELDNDGDLEKVFKTPEFQEIQAELDTQDSTAIDSIKAVKDKAKDNIDVSYDLSNRDTLEKVFIELIKASNPSAYLKSIGTTLGKFLWTSVVVSEEIAYEWYKNSSSSNIKENYLMRMNIPAANRQYSTRIKNDQKSKSLYIQGLIVASKRGLDPETYLKEIFDLYREDSEILSIPISRLINDIRGVVNDTKTLVRVMLNMIRDGYADTIDNNDIVYEIATPKGRAPRTFLSEYFIENFNQFSTQDQEIMAKFVLFSSQKHGYSNRAKFSKKYNNAMLKYKSEVFDKVSLLRVFGEPLADLYDILEENNFYNSPFLKTLKIAKIEDLEVNDNTTTEEMYEFYKGRNLQLIPEDASRSIIEYVITNNLQMEWVKSMNNFSRFDSIVITGSEFTTGEYLTEEHLGLSRSHRNLFKEEYEFLIYSVAEYIFRNNRDTIFTSWGVSEMTNLSRGIKNLFSAGIFDEVYSSIYGALNGRVVNILNELSILYGKPTIEISIASTGARDFSYLFGEVGDLLNLGIDVDVAPAPDLNTDSIIKGIMDFGIEYLIYGRAPQYTIGRTDRPTDILDFRNYTNQTDEVIDVKLGSGARVKIIRGVLKEFLNRDSLKLSAAGYYIGLGKVIDGLGPEFNELIVEVVNRIKELEGSDSTIHTDIGIQSKLIRNEAVDPRNIDKLTLLSIADNNSILDSTVGKNVIEIALENEEFIDRFIDQMYGKSPSYINGVIEVMKDNNKYEEFKDALVSEPGNSLTRELYNGEITIINAAETLLAIGDDDLSTRISKIVINGLSDISSRNWSNLIRLDKDKLITCLHYIDDDEFNDFVETIPSPYNRQIGLLYISRRKLVEYGVKSQLFEDSNLIKPNIELDDVRLLQILEFNNIRINSKHTRRRKGETYTDYLSRISEDSKDNFNLGKIKAEHEEISDEQMMRRTIEYNRLHSNNKHGDVALKFIRSLNAGSELTKPSYYDFKESHPDTVMMPVFHGTGSIAASMIMRFGFSIIDADDDSAVGRMLGNGIYFSDILDKSAQYVGDSGFSRGKGTKGYILELEAVIGKKGIDYDDAGLDGSDGIRSPEWVVFNPGNQLSIKKAHEVVLVSKSEVDKMESQLNESYGSKHATALTGFAEWIKPLQEMFGVDATKYSSTFIFRDGDIPQADGTIKNWRLVDTLMNINTQKYPDLGYNIVIQSSAMGTAVTIYYNNPEIPLEDVYIINNTGDFVEEEGIEYQIFNSFLNDTIEELDFSII